MTDMEWKVIPGRCGACTKFEKDFGGDGVAYGHCGVKNRAGSLSTGDAKCSAYNARQDVPPSPAEAKTKRFNPWDTSLDGMLTPTTPSKTRRTDTRRRPKPEREAAETLRLHQREQTNHQQLEFGDDTMERHELRALIEEAIDDALSIKAVDMLDRFQGGTITVSPGVEGTQSKDIPIDVLFRKIVNIRDSLRVLEQKLNTHAGLSNADRVQLQQYVTRCYGSLTTFNFLFQNKEDGFSSTGNPS